MAGALVLDSDLNSNSIKLIEVNILSFLILKNLFYLSDLNANVEKI